MFDHFYTLQKNVLHHLRSGKNILLLVLLFFTSVTYAQLSFTTSITPSTCSANGTIDITVSGGIPTYYYQIVSSSSGIIRPVQNSNVFNNLPAGTYTIRVIDNNNLTATNTVAIPGNYIPLSFSHMQQQSSIVLTPLNGKPPYTFTYSMDGGLSYLPPTDSNSFSCMQPGNYLFRVYDSCSNFYSENVVVNNVIIDATYSCVPDFSNNTKSIILNSVINGNGGYSFIGFGQGYYQTNTTGNFYNINRCNKNIAIRITDKCNITATDHVCPSPEYTFDIGCINFKDHRVTITNVRSGNGLPYQYFANGVTSGSTTVQNFPIPADSIMAGLMDSCGFENTVEIRRMKIIKMDSSGCKKGILNISSVYKIDNIQRSFPPTRYFSVSGPTSFDVTDAVKTDSSVISVTGLQNGLYKYKITNACGDEVDDSFYYEKKCFSELSVHKFQSCNSLMFYLEKDCDIDTTVVYTLKDLNGHFIAQNSTGTFSNLSNDSCYEVGAHEYACDTTIYDTISPVRPLIRIFPNSCNEVSFAVSLQIKKQCGHGVIPKFYSVRDFVLMDSSFNILQTNTTGLVNPVPPKTYWIYARISDCNSDTVRYSPGRSFTDTMRFCITPSVRVSGSQCMFAWNVKLINNVKHTTYTLTGNGVNMQNAETFSGLDTGKYILKDGCSEQELYLPKYYNFISDVKAGCPSNALIIASAPVDSAYIDSIGNKYFFTVCDIPLMDYNIRVPGTNTLIAYNTSGVFPNLQNATTYDLIYKGDRNCNFFKKTITTPFYTRPSLTATYGLICNGNNATVKATVAGGTPPYTYEILNSATPQVITDSTFVIYNNLGLGTQQFRVSDVCGISTDYSTEVLSVDFQPTFKKKCNGQVELIAPDILNTTYTWTDKNGNVLGNTPIVYTYPTGDDTFTVVMHYLTCNISKSLFVADFSSSVVTAHAGIDYATDTTFANLQANLAINGAIGTWRQIAPSSGNSIFADIHDPKTRVTIDVFPGQYTYVWSIVDTAIHCISEDTVVVSYLPCPGILPIMYTKATRDASCSANGQIDITITQASNTVHYLWNTGDTTATLKNLKDSIYIVTISDETSCTPDIRDTTVIRATVPTFKNVSANICEGDSFIINNKKYSVQGNYSDTLVNSVGCDSILLIAINVLLKSESFDSAVRCSGEKYILQNGQTVTASGDYSVKLLNSVGCDSILYSHIIFNPVHQKNIDTTICAGLSFLLPGGSSVSQAGNYIDTLQNIFGCDSIVLTNLSVRDSLQNVYLGNDTTICEEDHILLTVSYPSYAKYLWQDNSTQPQFDISTEGIFYVKVYDGCTSTSDTINIQTMDCSCNFYVPTGFSPNNDGMNDVFLPFNRCVFFKDYSFSIFSRWGAEVFSTGDPASAWTGDYNNGTAQVDTYLWTLQYFDILRNQKITTKGTVTLIR